MKVPLSAVGGFLAPFLMYVGISLLYASVAGALVSFVEPLAAGSGIAEVKTYLNGIHIRGLLAVSTPSVACSYPSHVDLLPLFITPFCIGCSLFDLPTASVRRLLRVWLCTAILTLANDSAPPV